MWAAIPLAVAIVGMAMLVAFKALELRHGRIFFKDVRARLDARVERLFVSLKGDVPHRGKLLIADVLHYFMVQTIGLALVTIRFVERRLARFVDMVKGRQKLRGDNGTRSMYLRDVTNHRDEVRRVNGYHPKK